MINKCLIPVAGYGIRFLPVTKSIPKEMLPIVNKPLIQYGVEEAVEAGIDEFTFITGRNKTAIEDYFDSNFELEHKIKGSSKESKLEPLSHLISKCTFTYTRQNEINGLGHAVLKGKKVIGNNSFAVLLPDDICINDGDSVLSQMVKLSIKYRSSIVAIVEVAAYETALYGIIDGHENSEGLIEVTNMIEKPQPADAPSKYGIVGRYILTPDIFDILEMTPIGTENEIQLTDALLTQAKSGSVLGYKIKGIRFDCGSVNGYINAVNYIYNKSKETKKKA